MLRSRVLTILRSRDLVPTSLRVPALLVGAVLYVLAWVFASDTGAWLCLACNVVLLVGAWPLYRDLAGLVRWGRLNTWQRIGAAVLYLLGYVVPFPVIVRGLQQAWRARQARLAARPGQIAKLEKDLGL
jgi:hypothetical protein